MERRLYQQLPGGQRNYSISFDVGRFEDIVPVSNNLRLRGIEAKTAVGEVSALQSTFQRLNRLFFVISALVLAVGVFLAAVLLFKMQATAATAAEEVEAWGMALEYPFGFLRIAAGLSIVGLGAVLSRGSISKRQALLLLPPLFWAAFHLLVAYRQYCVSANLALFTPDIFASIACVMAYYHFARMLYGKPAPRSFAFWAAMTIILTLTDTLGYALSHALGGIAVIWSTEAIVRACCLLCACVFLMVELILMTSRAFTTRAGRLSVPFTPTR